MALLGMTTLGITITVISIIVGSIIGYFIFKRFPNLLDKKDKKIKEVINDPHLLAKKLKSNGLIYDMGDKLDVLNIKVEKDIKTGKDVVKIERIKKPKKEKEIQEKIKGKSKKKGLKNKKKNIKKVNKNKKGDKKK